MELCSYEVCPANGFQCKYGACVHGKTKCNGLKDCADGSDEFVELCAPPTPAPSPQAPVDDAVTPHIVTPEIDRKSCPAIFDDPNISAVHAYDTSKKVNDGEIIGEFQQIIYRCRRNSILDGEKDNLCLDGQWRYPIPKCLMGCSPEVINAVTFSTKCTLDHLTPCTGLIHPHTRVDISCSTGYRKQFHDVPETITCRVTGEWDYHPASCVPVCGKVTASETSFIVGGEKVNITTVPWHAAIYKSDGGGIYDHICGGTIYSAKLVISAARCFWDEKRDKPEENSLFRVAVGKVYRSYDAYEPNFKQIFDVTEIHIPDSFGGASRTYENDIAMLVLSNYISYKDHIKPICISWLHYEDRKVKPGTVGRIAAWGKTMDDKYGEELKAVDLLTFSREECMNNTFFTGEKFCAGAPYDGSVCQGDSGAGYVVKDEDTGTYYLRGVLSVGSNRTCERDHTKIFTNIQYHKEMITDYEVYYRPK